jgi:hypothetical protein
MGDIGYIYSYRMVFVLRVGFVYGFIEGSEIWVYSAQYTE